MLLAEGMETLKVSCPLQQKAHPAHALRAQPEGLSPEEITIPDFPQGRQAGMVPGRYVRLSVTDTGSGMPPKTLDQVFDPFFTTKPVREGTGLGLSMVRGIVASHGGYVTVDSRRGQGTTFRVKLPAAAPHLTNDAARSPARVLSPCSTSRTVRSSYSTFCARC